VLFSSNLGSLSRRKNHLLPSAETNADVLLFLLDFQWEKRLGFIYLFIFDSILKVLEKLGYFFGTLGAGS